MASYATFSPAVYQGVVFFPAKDGTLNAYDAFTGSLKWHQNIGPSIDAADPTVADGVVYQGNTAGVLYAFHTDSGALLWSAPTGGYIDSSTAVAGGVAYQTANTNQLLAFDAIRGGPAWTAQTEGNLINGAAVSGGLVYVGTDSSSLLAFRATTGELVWSAPVPGTSSCPGAFPLNVVSTPSIWNGVVYVGSTSCSLTAFDATTGEQLWSAVVDGQISGKGPSLANGVAYVASEDNYLYAFDLSNGSLLWKYNLNGDHLIQAGSQPAIVDGSVYVGITFGYRLYAFALPAGAAQLTVNPSEGTPGSPVVLAGSGFAPNERIRIYANGLGSNILTITQTNGVGAFSTSTIIPPLRAGDHRLLAQGQMSGSRASATLTVTSSIVP